MTFVHANSFALSGRTIEYDECFAAFMGQMCMYARLRASRDSIPSEFSLTEQHLPGRSRPARHRVATRAALWRHARADRGHGERGR